MSTLNTISRRTTKNLWA